MSLSSDYGGILERREPAFIPAPNIVQYRGRALMGLRSTTAKEAKPEPLYVRVSDCPVAYGVDRSTIDRWAVAGHVKIYKRGRMSWIKAAAMTKIIEGAVEGFESDQARSAQALRGC